MVSQKKRKEKTENKIKTKYMLILISDEIFNFGGFINMNLLGLVLLFVLFIKNQNHRFYADIIQQRVVLENQLYKKKLKSFNFKFGIKRKLLNILKNNTFLAYY